MVETPDQIKSTNTGLSHPITQSLNCRNMGFMVLQCKVESCQEQFLCYTKTSFKQRLHSLTHDFKVDNKPGGHQLKKHFNKNHSDFGGITSISDCYKEFYLEEPSSCNSSSTMSAFHSTSDSNSPESIQQKWCNLLNSKLSKTSHRHLFPKNSHDQGFADKYEYKGLYISMKKLLGNHLVLCASSDLL